MIDPIFIEKAISIREEYLKCIEKIDIDSNELLECKLEIENLLEKGDSLVEEYEESKSKNSESKIYETIEEISKTIENLQKRVKPYKDRVKELEKESDMLYIAIKDRYPDISQEEIKKQITPHLKR